MPKNQQDRMIDTPYAKRAGAGIINITGSSGGSGVTDHGLLTGLGDDDHPHYLTAARGDARYLLAGGTFDGPGLLYSGGVLSVGAGAGITVNADDVALTTPGTLTATSSNSASGSHTHAVTASDDVGTTPAASLLKSTAGGGLTLGTLTVRGGVDVINNGDLTVGANVLFVDASQANVGINCAPDPQFALDVAGPARAQYFIGPHAIQLKDVLLLAHYDGRQPFATNFSGEPNGHMGQVATVTGGILYRPGMWGTKALQVAENTTNLVTNPSCEINTAYYDSDNSSEVKTRAAAAAYVGDYGLSIEYPAGSTGPCNVYWNNTSVTITSGATYTFSAYLKRIDGADISAAGVQMVFNNSGVQTPTTVTDVGDGWYRFTLTYTTGTTSSLCGFTNLVRGQTYYTDGWQVEQKAYVTPYHDATMTGSATRAAASLAYPTLGNIKAQQGTIMLWAKVAALPTGGAGLWCAGDANTEFDSYIHPTGYVAVRSNGSVTAQGGSATVGEWAHIACTWDATANEIKLYVDGVQVGSTGTLGGAPTLGTSLYVGSLIAGAVPLNGWLDDFVVLERVADADELRAVYESDAPIFAESSRFSFRATPAGLVWADDEGLWMRATDGGTILGVYGGNGTKSWGGVSLNQGDLLVGDSSNSLMWDDSASKLIVKGGGGNVQIDNDGLWFSTQSTAQRSASLTWLIGSQLYAQIAPYGLDGSSTLYLEGRRSGSGAASVVLEAWNQSATSCRIALTQSNAGANSIFVRGSTTFADNVSVSGTLAIAGNLSTGGNLTVTGQTVVMNGTYSVPSIRAASNSTGLYFEGAGDRIGFTVTGLPSADVNPYGFSVPSGYSLTLNEGNIPGNPTTGNQCRIFMYDDKLVISYKDGTQIRYKYLTLSGTGVTWTHTTGF